VLLSGFPFDSFSRGVPNRTVRWFGISHKTAENPSLPNPATHFGAIHRHPLLAGAAKHIFGGFRVSDSLSNRIFRRRKAQSARIDHALAANFSNSLTRLRDCSLPQILLLSPAFWGFKTIPHNPTTTSLRTLSAGQRVNVSSTRILRCRQTKNQTQNHEGTDLLRVLLVPLRYFAATSIQAKTQLSARTYQPRDPPYPLAPRSPPAPALKLPSAPTQQPSATHSSLRSGSSVRRQPARLANSSRGN